MALPYYAFYPFDWLGDIRVQQLSLEETGAYINLLAYMWCHGHNCTLPLDDRMLSRVLHLPMDRWIEMRDVLIDGPSAVFVALDDGTFTNKRLREEFEKAVDKTDKARTSGKASADKKALKKLGFEQTLSDRSTVVEQTLNDRSTVGQLLDLDLDKTSEEQEQRYDDDNRAHTREDVVDYVSAPENPLVAMWSECQDIYPAYNSIQQEALNAYVVKDGMEPGVVVNALRQSRLRNNGVNYAISILEKQLHSGIRTLAEVEMEHEIYAAKNRSAEVKHIARGSPQTKQDRTADAFRNYIASTGLDLGG